MTPATTVDVSEESTAAGARERILHATLELIANDGIGALSNRRIAKAATVSLGTLTYHFPSQAELLREGLLLYVGEEVARISAIADGLRARRPHPSLREISGEVQQAIAAGLARSEPLAEMELHLQAARDPQLRPASQRCFLAYEELAGAALEALRVPDAARHARSVVALMYGMGLQQLGSGRHDAQATTAALGTIVRGAFAEGQPPPTREGE
ncbi:MAG: TetR/AcrR family transcriptional regulator [Solirubrobacterales bacterium]|nr:TetR/AcrR family transcriptional regulator [Solirubrobacterales bacterium]